MVLNTARLWAIRRGREGRGGENKSVENVEGVPRVSEIRKCRSWSFHRDSVMAIPRGYSERLFESLTSSAG